MLNDTLDAIASQSRSDDFDALEIRNLLIALCNDDSLDLHEFAHLDQHDRRLLLDARDAIDAIRTNDYARDELTDALLNRSLCPLHAIDYAICFDDQNDECAAIRLIHPSHDT